MGNKKLTSKTPELPQTKGTDIPFDKDAEYALNTIGRILQKGVNDKATDIHFESFKKGLRIRYRTDGVLHEGEQLPTELGEAVISRIKIMANLNPHEKNILENGRILLNVKGKELDARVSIAPCITGESAVMRILSREKCLMDMNGLGLTKANLEKAAKWCKKHDGLIIVSGPSGSGKTTTLYSMLQEMNDPKLKITTVEDPVECQIEGVNQLQVNIQSGITFSAALRNQLRQDPDTMMCGEIRDLDTAYLLVRAALTGHLALTSLHTRNAAETIRRLLDMGVEPFLINSVNPCVISQRLVRIICRDCITEYKPEEWAADLTREYKDMKFFKGKGCAKCYGFGYRGRTAIHELLELDDNMRRLIANNAGLEELRDQATKSGMITMRQDGFEKAKQGITTLEEVLRACAIAG